MKYINHQYEEQGGRRKWNHKGYQCSGPLSYSHLFESQSSFFPVSLFFPPLKYTQNIDIYIFFSKIQLIFLLGKGNTQFTRHRCSSIKKQSCKRSWKSLCSLFAFRKNYYSKMLHLQRDNYTLFCNNLPLFTIFYYRRFNQNTYLEKKCTQSRIVLLGMVFFLFSLSFLFVLVELSETSQNFLLHCCTSVLQKSKQG